MQYESFVFVQQLTQEHYIFFGVVCFGVLWFCNLLLHMKLKHCRLIFCVKIALKLFITGRDGKLNYQMRSYVSQNHNLRHCFF